MPHSRTSRPNISCSTVGRKPIVIFRIYTTIDTVINVQANIVSADIACTPKLAALLLKGTTITPKSPAVP